MAVIRYFGLPGCGKTTKVTDIALKAVRGGKYENVYCNVHLAVPGVTYLPFDVLGKYDIKNAAVIIDEAMVNCGDRDFKGFGKEKLWFFVEHRHMSCDVFLFSQEPDGIDKKIRSLTDRMYYIKKGLILGRWISTIYHIPYGIVWPDENSNGENLGRIVMGYMKPPWILSLFAERLFRPALYKYFDSWEIDKVLPELPSSYKPYAVDKMSVPVLRKRLRSARWLFKNVKKLRKKKRIEPAVAATVDFLNLPDPVPDVECVAV